jgi:hypothetical protein
MAELRGTLDGRADACGTPDGRADVWSPASERQDQDQEGVQTERAGSGHGTESAFNARETDWRHDARRALPCDIPALSPASSPCTPEPHRLPVPLPYVPAAHTQQGTDSNTPRHLQADTTLGRGRTMQDGGRELERRDHWRACFAGAEALSSSPSSSQDSWTRDGFSYPPDPRGKRAFQVAMQLLFKVIDMILMY